MSPPHTLPRIRQITPATSRTAPNRSSRASRRVDGRWRVRVVDHQRADPDGEVDGEDPAPADVVGDQAADQGADHAGGGEHAGEVADVAAPLPGGHQVAHDAEAQGVEPAAPDALHQPADHERHHRGGQPAHQRADQEDHDGGLEHAAPAVEIADLAPQRGGGGGREQVAHDHPRQVLEAAQVGDDGGQGGGHDRLVDGGDEHADHQARQRQHDLAMGDRTADLVGDRARGVLGCHRPKVL